MNQIEVTLRYRKSTKGTHVYENREAAISSLYISREDMPEQAPKEVKLVVTWNETDEV